MLGAPPAVLVRGTVVHDGRGVLQDAQALLGRGGGDGQRSRSVTGAEGPPEHT